MAPSLIKLRRALSWNFGPADCSAKYKAEARNSTMDIIVVGIGVLFFALSFAYVKACDRI
ncbi:MAG: hypothetical protein ABJB10_12380 [Mesorhizobium sp.]